MRGIRRLVCPECGETMPYKNLKELEKLRNEFDLVEGTEYLVFRTITRWLTFVLGFDSLSALVVLINEVTLTRFVLFCTLVLLTVSNIWIRKKLYPKTASSLSQMELHDDRWQDAYGAFALIAIVVGIPAGLYIFTLM